MNIEEVKELFEYGSWATSRTFAVTEGMTQEQRETTVTSSFESVIATLAHIVGGEWVWLNRWSGESPTTFPSWVLKPEVAELKRILKGVEADRMVFLNRLSDADLTRAVSYHAFDGKGYSLPLGKLIRHLVNHSTYHRGQLATQMRQVGITPPSTDFSRYLLEKQ